MAADVALDPQGESDAMNKARVDMCRMASDGETWDEIRATVAGRDDAYARHLRSVVATYEWHERLLHKRLLRLSLLLEKDLVP